MMRYENMNESNQAMLTSRKRIGAILVTNGKIREQDADRIVEMQKQRSMLFGEAAVQLKLVRKEDVEQALTAQLLIPVIDAEKFGLARELVIACKPLSKQAEAFRNIRTRLLLKSQNEHPISVAVVSEDAKAGKSYIAANLAIAFAQMGKRTIIIDSDLRRPQQHTLFNTTSSYGLSTILAKNEISDFAIKHEGLAHLSILPAGPLPLNPLELISHEVYAKVLENYRSRYDVIIVDTPPASEFSDVELIASTVNNALVVARKDHTPLDNAKAFVDKLRSHQLNLLGCVINTY